MFDLSELLENGLPIFQTDTDAVVLYRDQEPIRCNGETDDNVPGLIITEFNGIGDEIHHGLDQPVPIAGNNRHVSGYVWIDPYLFFPTS